MTQSNQIQQNQKHQHCLMETEGMVEKRLSVGSIEALLLFLWASSELLEVPSKQQFHVWPVRSLWLLLSKQKNKRLHKCHWILRLTWHRSHRVNCTVEVLTEGVYFDSALSKWFENLCCEYTLSNTSSGNNTHESSLWQQSQSIFISTVSSQKPYWNGKGVHSNKSLASTPCSRLNRFVKLVTIQQIVVKQSLGRSPFRWNSNSWRCNFFNWPIFLVCSPCVVCPVPCFLIPFSRPISRHDAIWWGNAEKCKSVVEPLATKCKSGLKCVLAKGFHLLRSPKLQRLWKQKSR